MEQLKEVYGLQNKWYQKISSQLKLNAQDIQKIEINKAKASILSHHPYISRKMTKKLIKERVKNGEYINIEDLQKRNVLSGNWIKKIKEYLLF